MAKRHKKGQPVLLGTASVESSEVVSSLLDVAKITHQVLNAKHDKGKPAVVAVAGVKGRRHRGHQHGRPWYRYHARRQRRVPRRCEAQVRRLFSDDTPDEYEALAGHFGGRNQGPGQDEHEEVVKLGGLYVLGTSATNPAVSTTSCAAVPAVREIRVNPVSTCPSKMI